MDGGVDGGGIGFWFWCGVVIVEIRSLCDLLYSCQSMALFGDEYMNGVVFDRIIY